MSLSLYCSHTSDQVDSQTEHDANFTLQQIGRGSEKLSSITLLLERSVDLERIDKADRLVLPEVGCYTSSAKQATLQVETDQNASAVA